MAPQVLPTQEQLFDADCEDAGEFILQMRARPEAYAAFISANALPWDTWHAPHGPELEPVVRRVEHLCSLVVRTIESVVKHGRPSKGGPLKPKDVEFFRRNALGQR